MKVIFLLIPSLIFFTTSLYMYVQNPAANNIYTIKEVRAAASKLDKADTLVTLSGKLTEQINHDSFWFTDNGGKIRIELEDNVLSGYTFTPEQAVIITGEVDYDLLEGTEIEVEQLQVITR